MKKLILGIVMALGMSANIKAQTKQIFITSFKMTFSNRFEYVLPVKTGNYLIKVKGTYGIANSKPHRDACYGLNGEEMVVFDNHWLLNGIMPKPDNGKFNPNHEYEITRKFTNDNKLVFEFDDPNMFDDNCGELEFEIYTVYNETGSGIGVTATTENIDNKNQIKIYPNPASKYLVVEVPGSTNETHIKHVYLRKMDGGMATAFSQNQTIDSDILIDLTYVRDGMYVLEVIDNKGNKVSNMVSVVK